MCACVSVCVLCVCVCVVGAEPWPAQTCRQEAVTFSGPAYWTLLDYYIYYVRVLHLLQGTLQADGKMFEDAEEDAEDAEEETFQNTSLLKHVGRCLEITLPRFEHPARAPEKDVGRIPPCPLFQ